ncbi:hypothetical protein DPMN_109656 [Dreissena polymorpha]|uniref:EF-hand domain-containing protein n=1 Tax=Dreissena polymorpha TaxID=45954 RepID=A0A9D4KAZ2_DREPO|nr:hypothetical protein DPMN_109656 [Dreissena polymorpha]
MRQAFRVFDKDDDGNISTHKHRTVMRSLGQDPTVEELEDIVLQADNDGECP